MSKNSELIKQAKELCGILWPYSHSEIITIPYFISAILLLFLRVWLYVCFLMQYTICFLPILILFKIKKNVIMCFLLYVVIVFHHTLINVWKIKAHWFFLPIFSRICIIFVNKEWTFIQICTCFWNILNIFNFCGFFLILLINGRFIF